MIASDFWKTLESGKLTSPLQQKDLIQVEHKYGRKLPTSYVDLLKIQNGGYINYTVLPEWKDNISIDTISGIGGLYDVLTESDYYIEEWDLPSDILLLSGDGHWWVCFDYRGINNDTEPKISYLDSEYEIDVVIADTFADFIKKLEKEV